MFRTFSNMRSQTEKVRMTEYHQKRKDRQTAVFVLGGGSCIVLISSICIVKNITEIFYG